MPLTASRRMSASTDLALDEVCDLVCAPACGVGASGTCQLLSDERAQHRISCEAIYEVCEIVGAEDAVLVSLEEAGRSFVPTYKDHCYVIPVDQGPITGRKPKCGEAPETDVIAVWVGDPDRRVVADQGGVGIIGR